MKFFSPDEHDTASVRERGNREGQFLLDVLRDEGGACRVGGRRQPEEHPFPVLSRLLGAGHHGAVRHQHLNGVMCNVVGSWIDDLGLPGLLVYWFASGRMLHWLGFLSQ